MLEKQRVLQDTYDTLQAEFQFELISTHSRWRSRAESAQKCNQDQCQYSFTRLRNVHVYYTSVSNCYQVLTVWYGFVGVAA